MSLTQDDLEKIKAVVDARADLTDARVDRLQADVTEIKETILPTLATKEQLEQVKTMFTEDHLALAEDVVELQTLPMIAVELAKK